MNRWLSSRTLVILALAGSVILGPANPAQAASLTHNMKVTYHNSWLFKSRAIHRCITFRTHGTIKYTAVVVPLRPPIIEIKFKNIRLVNPVITATVQWLRSNGSCGAKKRLSKLSLGQHWAGYACGFNPSLSAGFPWGVSLSAAWPNCGNRRQAGYTSTYTKNSSFYKQSNSGSPAHFGNVTIDHTQRAPSFGVFSSAVAYVGSRSDSYGAGDGSSAKKAGLRKPAL